MLTRKEALAIYHAGPETVVRVLLQMDARMHVLEQQVQDLTARLEASEQRVKQLGDQLAKNSRNSSKPPSTDGFNKPKPKSLRGKSGRPSGGQRGHPGHTLQRVEKPNHIEVHRVDGCAACGRSLANQPAQNVETRQVHDLPPRRLIVTDHQAEQKRCSCGHLNKAAFPEGVNAPVQYGPDVRALAVYLNQYQLLPCRRTCELLNDLFGCSMSEGTLSNIIAECDDILRAPVEQIKEQIAQSPIVHFDETGSRVEKKLWWLHSASTENATYYGIHPRRGTQAHQAIGILPTFTGRAVHDAYHSYLTYDCPHGLCNAHHLRELTFVDEQLQQGWAGQMKRLLQDMHKAAEQAKLSGIRLSQARIKCFEDRYQRILDDGYAANPLPDPLAGTCLRAGTHRQAADRPAKKKRGRPKKTKPRNLLERLDQHREKALAFLYDLNVPFDNNLAERDIRMMKVQQKISGLFRTQHGANSFCRIRSYISTARKNSLEAFEALARAFANASFVPSLASLDSGTAANLDTS